MTNENQSSPLPEIDYSDPDERPPRKRRYIQCADRMCGSLDCPRCRPENFVAGVYIGDIDNQTDDSWLESLNDKSTIKQWADELAKRLNE